MLATMLLLFYTGTANAVPRLQLDIDGGTYDALTETIIINESTATVYAYLWINGDDSLLGSYDEFNVYTPETYYLSAALIPYSDTACCSFSINGNEIAVLGDMNEGYAPLGHPDFLAAELEWDGQDLASHGVFPTYYWEEPFAFVDADGNPYNDPIAPYDTQDRADGTLGTSFDDLHDTNGDMYYMSFVINRDDLNRDFSLHFDLYSTVLHDRKWTDFDVDDFAPFSHDAEMVPESGTLFLLGLGLIGIWGWTRRYGAANIR